MGPSSKMPDILTKNHSHAHREKAKARRDKGDVSIGQGLKTATGTEINGPDSHSPPKALSWPTLCLGLTRMVRWKMPPGDTAPCGVLLC